MAIAKEFFDWAQLPPAATPYNRCSPNLLALRTYLDAEYGTGKFLGCFANRPIRNGTRPSFHAYGAALDYEPVLERKSEVIEFLIAYSHELGIQAIHDYKLGRVWRANRQSWRNSIAAQSWAEYLHIETNRTQWGNAQPVSLRLSVAPIKPVLQKGSRGPYVTYLQKVLTEKANQPLVADGVFGPKTEAAVQALQAWLKHSPTGVVDRELWAVIDWLHNA